ncbi:unnamed protein product, partial [Mesorhabditis spiculigera]
MADPLQVLREYAQGRRTFKEIVQGNDTYYLFDDIAYDKNAKTSLTIYGRTDDYYTLESLYFIWERRDIPHPAYVKEAAGKSIRAVGRPDRRDLLDYLRGDRQEVPTNFDRLAQTAPPIPASRFQEFEPERKRAKLDPSAEATVQREAGSATPAVDESNLRALSDNLTADKIAALRKKKANHQKRTTVLDDMDITTGEAKVERVWHTRSNCMESLARGSNFSFVLQMIQGLKTREETEARNKALGGQQQKMDPNRGKKNQLGYSRYDQEQFDKNDHDFGAEMTFVGTNMKTSPEKRPLDGGPANRGPLTQSQPSVSSTDSGAPKKRTQRTPIIIIPASTNQHSIISMYNVRDILQELSFTAEDVRKQQGKRENEVLIQRRKGGQTVPYRVVDTPQRLTSEEWDRVVAVFALGPTWQFKGWPRWNGNPTEIFNNVAGFHLAYDNVPVEPNVAKWSVKVLALSRDKRHLDRARLQVFWDLLDRHIAKAKPHLRF